MNNKLLRILDLLIALAGLLVLLFNSNLADAASGAIMARHGGGMDTNLFMLLLQSAADMYRILGAVLLAVGLFRVTEPERP